MTPLPFDRLFDTRLIPAAVAVFFFFGSPGTVYRADAAESHHEHASRPRAAISGVLSLDVYAQDGKLHLLTGLSDGAGARSLWYQGSGDEGKTWLPAVRVDAHAPVAMFRRGNDAQIAVSGQTMLAVWTGKGTGWGGGGTLVTAVSRDGGKTWQPAALPADDESTTTHAFAELFVDASRFGLAWIDSRNSKSGVRYAWLSETGKRWSPNVTVDATTCECCWNSAVTKNGKIFLMYRGNMPRDMMLAVSGDGAQWQRTGTVGAFNWKIEACPETGGALIAAPSGAMHALVWTGEDRALGLHYLVSRDAGASWDAPQRLGSDDARRSDIAAAPDGTLAAVWDDSSDNVVRASISRNGGKSWSVPSPLSIRGDRALGPRVLAVSGGFRVFWTQARAGGTAYEWKSALLAVR